jgi:quercetin dioxygenase-like cupin family protein
LTNATNIAARAGSPISPAINATSGPSSTQLSYRTNREEHFHADRIEQEHSSCTVAVRSLNMTTGSMLISGAAILAMIAECGAGQPAAKWKELQRHNIPGTALEGVTTMIEIPPGAVSARHSHPGEDFGYLIEGTVVLQVDGKAPVTLRAGDAFLTERGQIHNARNIGTTTARAVDTYIIDKGKPGVIPAP